jgi:HK97 family phage major capsid protein
MREIMKRINLSVDDIQETHLKNESIRTGKPQSEIMRNLIDSGIERKDLASDVAQYQNGKNLDWQKALSGKNLEGYEAEVAQEGREDFKRAGIPTLGNLQIPFSTLSQRDLSVTGSDAAGGYLVAEELRNNSFVDMLHNRMKVREMGATMLTDLSSDIAIPKQLTGGVAAWEGEMDEGAESSPTFGQISMSPNRVGTYVEISKMLQVQSALSVNNIIKDLLSTSISLAVDYAALHGLGSGNQPLGIAGTSNIGDVAGGTNGAIPTHANIVELETDVTAQNGVINDNTTGYLTNPQVKGVLKQVLKNATYGSDAIWEDGQMNGYRAEASSQVSSTLTKGNQSLSSAIFFGDWSNLIIGQWGGIDLVIDPYTLAKTNRICVTLNAYFDIAIKHPESFSCMLDALTA